MPGPKYNYLNVRDELRIVSGSLSFGDSELCISSSTDGQLDVNADTTFKVTAPTCELEGSSGITLDGNVTIDGSHTLTTGTGTFTLTAGATVPSAQAITFTAGQECLRFPNDGIIASGQYGLKGAGNTFWKTYLISSNVQGWIRVKIVSGSGWNPSSASYYLPLFSSATMSG